MWKQHRERAEVVGCHIRIDQQTGLAARVVVVSGPDGLNAPTGNSRQQPCKCKPARSSFRKCKKVRCHMGSLSVCDNETNLVRPPTLHGCIDAQRRQPAHGKLGCGRGAALWCGAISTSEPSESQLL